MAERAVQPRERSRVRDPVGERTYAEREADLGEVRDDDEVAANGRERRDRVRNQRLAAEDRQRLGRAEARAPATREHGAEHAAHGQRRRGGVLRT
jgi:hypothetical protein